MTPAEELELIQAKLPEWVEESRKHTEQGKVVRLYSGAVESAEGRIRNLYCYR